MYRPAALFAACCASAALAQRYRQRRRRACPRPRRCPPSTRFYMTIWHAFWGEKWFPLIKTAGIKAQ